MLTFILIAGFLLAICYILFKHRTFGSKRLTSIMIIGIGTLVLYTVASGLIAKRYPLKKVIYDTEVLKGVITPVNDSVYIKASIGFGTKSNKIFVEEEESYEAKEITIKFLSVYDTIPKLITTQYERQIDSYLWVADWGIPYKNRHRTVYIPNDADNIKMVAYIFDTLKKTEDEEAI